MTKRYDTAEIFRIMLTDNDEESNMTPPVQDKGINSTLMAAELLRDIQQRNYGAAETKARQLWNQLGREAKAMRKERAMIKATLDEAERRIHQQRVAAAGQAGREVAARLEARRLAELKHKEPDIFLLEVGYRISCLNNAHPQTQHSEGMRAGFMYARAIYKGTRK
jgi:hypothetical protein